MEGLELGRGEDARGEAGEGAPGEEGAQAREVEEVHAYRGEEHCVRGRGALGRFVVIKRDREDVVAGESF